VATRPGRMGKQTASGASSPTMVGCVAELAHFQSARARRCRLVLVSLTNVLSVTVEDLGSIARAAIASDCCLDLLGQAAWPGKEVLYVVVVVTLSASVQVKILPSWSY
jgi:hypothetical protein